MVVGGESREVGVRTNLVTGEDTMIFVLNEFLTFRLRFK